MKLVKRVEMVMAEIQSLKRNGSNIFTPTKQVKVNYKVFIQDLVIASQSHPQIKNAIRKLPTRLRSSYWVLIIAFSMFFIIGLPVLIYFVTPEWKMRDVGLFSFIMVGISWAVFILLIERIRKKQETLAENLVSLKQILKEIKI